METVNTNTLTCSNVHSVVSHGSLVIAIQRAAKYLAALQHQDGYWVGELESDARLTASYVPFMHFMNGGPEENRTAKTVKYLLTKQNHDGSWPKYFGGRGELDVTVQSYFALKLAGISADAPDLKRAREFILRSGGVSKTNAITKTWLALFGQFDWGRIPSIPIELMLLPAWSPLSIYNLSGCARQTMVALMVISLIKPVTMVPETAQVPELYAEYDDRSRFGPETTFGWRSSRCGFESKLDGVAKSPLGPARYVALRKAERWILERQEVDGSWGGTISSSVFSLIALTSLGYRPGHPVIKRGLSGIEGLIAEDDRTLRIQPATSPVWDTAWSVIALRSAGVGASDPVLARAGNWLLDKQIYRPGDWSVRNTDASPGGWAFEFCNDIYPDVDDTAVVCRALRELDLGSGNRRRDKAIERGLRWALSMQSKDGGWAAFDRHSGKVFLKTKRLAGIETQVDPTCADVTAHILELLGEVRGHDRARKRGIAYLRRQQESDGAWIGCWGVNRVYGTASASAGLRAVWQDPTHRCMQKAAAWLESHQNRDGGWGESCESYDDRGARCSATSTASQTAWALMGLLAAGKSTESSVARGVQYLVDSQDGDGSWREELHTGTGFPGAIYFKYALYPVYFPLLALGKYSGVFRCLQSESTRNEPGAIIGANSNK